MINGGHFTKELQTVKTAVILVSHSWTVFLLDLLFLLPLSVASFLKLPMFFAAPFLLPAIGWFGAKLVLWWQIYEGHSISKNLLMKLWLYYFKELLYPYWWVTILELPILMVQLWIVFLSSLLFSFSTFSSPNYLAYEDLKNIVAFPLVFAVLFLRTIAVPVIVLTQKTFIGSLKAAISFLLKNIRFAFLFFLSWGVIGVSNTLMNRLLFRQDKMYLVIFVAVTITLALFKFVLEASMFIYIYHHLREKTTLQHIFSKAKVLSQND